MYKWCPLISTTLTWFIGNRHLHLRLAWVRMIARSILQTD